MTDPKHSTDASTGTPASSPSATRADDDLDDTGQPWRHPPVAPKDEDPLKSFGRSISETVTGSVDDDPAKGTASTEPGKPRDTTKP